MLARAMPSDTPVGPNVARLSYPRGAAMSYYDDPPEVRTAIALELIASSLERITDAIERLVELGERSAGVEPETSKAHSSPLLNLACNMCTRFNVACGREDCPV